MPNDVVVKGHNLVLQGRVPAGQPQHGVCTCGERSATELANVDACRGWHRQHKLKVLADKSGHAWPKSAASSSQGKPVLLQGHHLVVDGAASFPQVVSCVCKKQSPELVSLAAGRSWHRLHVLEVLAERAGRAWAFKVALDAELPFAGPCPACGAPDKRHGVLDEVATHMRQGAPASVVAERYHLSEDLVCRIAAEWEPEGEIAHMSEKGKATLTCADSTS